MTKGNDIIARMERQHAARGGDPRDLLGELWRDALRKVGDPRREMEQVARMYAASRGRKCLRSLGASARATTIEWIEWFASMHDMDVDAEAMVARAEAETNPLGLTVIEGGGGGSPPTSAPPRSSPPTGTPPAAA